MDTKKFERDRTIDPSRLDVEAVQQADIFFDWAEQAAAARAKMERRKFELDVLEAQLNLECREEPEKFGLPRVTEAAVTMAVKACDRYINAYDALLRARANSALFDKAVEAMEQKKRMIEVLITLHGQQYFAGPSTPRDLPASYREYRERVSERADKRVKHKARRVRRRND